MSEVFRSVAIIFMGLSVTLDIRPDGWRRGKEVGEG